MPINSKPEIKDRYYNRYLTIFTARLNINVNRKQVARIKRTDSLDQGCKFGQIPLWLEW